MAEKPGEVTPPPSTFRTPEQIMIDSAKDAKREADKMIGAERALTLAKNYANGPMGLFKAEQIINNGTSIRLTKIELRVEPPRTGVSNDTLMHEYASREAQRKAGIDIRPDLIIQYNTDKNCIEAKVERKAVRDGKLVILDSNFIPLQFFSFKDGIPNDQIASTQVFQAVSNQLTIMFEGDK